MENREVSIIEVLDFREKKAELQERMYVDNPDGVVVSLGMNIPGPVKTGSSIFHAFWEGKRALQEIILEKSGIIVEERTLERKAGYAAIYLVRGIDRKKLKEIAVWLEETHTIGRVFDVDILGKNLEPISRTEIGRDSRKCLICNGDAKVCGRSRAHTVLELQEKVASIICNWEEAQV